MKESLFAYRQLFALSTGLAVVFALSVWSGNANFISNWVGTHNYSGPLVDLALAFTIIAGLWNMPNRVILSANLAVRGQCLVRLIEGALKLGLSIWLGKRYGVVGVIGANFIAALLTSMWFLPLLTARMFDYPFWKFLWGDAARVFLLIALVMPVALLSRSAAVNITGFTGAVVGAALTGTIGLALVWFLMLDKSVRERLPIRNLYTFVYNGTSRFLNRSFAR